MDLSSLSDDELLSLKNETSRQISIEHINQHARKILINALYGAIGNNHFRYYSLANAKAITLGGQLSTRWARRKINEYLNKLFKTDIDYTIYGDTDSLYLGLKPLADKFPNKTEDELVDIMDKFCENNLQKVINDGYDELAEYVNAFEQKMFMDREVIATKAFFCDSKKRYAMFVKDNEGIRKDKLKISGIETQKSTTPKAVQKALKHCIMLILTKTEVDLQSYVDEFRDEFNTIDYRLLSEVKPANNLTKWETESEEFVKGTPGHIKPIIVYNRLAKEYNFDPILEGEKVNILPLKLPNILRTDKICFSSGGKLPVQISEIILGILDYNIMWENYFMKPLNSICDDIKYKSENTFSVDDFM